MTETEKKTILAFARGDRTLRDEAIAIHRQHLQAIGPRGNAYMEFMAEVDNPLPDFNLRSTYRRRLLEGHEEALHGN